MRMDQGLAWMLAVLLAGIGGSGFYWWATITASSSESAMIAAGTVPKEQDPSTPAKSSTTPGEHDEDKGHGSTHEPPAAHNEHESAHSEKAQHAEPATHGKINASEPAAWSYQGSAGPRYWARLDPQYIECGAAKGQSPVDLDNTRLDPKLKPLVFHYRDTNLTTTMRGQELTATVSDGNFVEIEGDRYNLHSISLHTPSEHHLQSVPYEMEIQFNHRSATGDLAIIAMFVAAGKSNEDLQLLLASLPKGDGDERELAGFPIGNLLPKKRTYFHYKGSLTAPPCTRDVAWYFFTTAVEASSRDIERATRLVINNSRPLQKAAGRVISRSNR